MLDTGGKLGKNKKLALSCRNSLMETWEYFNASTH